MQFKPYLVFKEMEAIKRQSRGRTPAPVADPIPEAEASPAPAEPEAVVFPGEPEPDQAPTTATAAADEDEPTTLAIDDADDFGDDGLDDSDGDDDGDETDADPLVAADPAVVVEAKPLIPGVLQPRPLAEFTELGSLPEDEQALQALMLYTNPRQAKRQCGRTQRVIKVPDAGVLERRSSYLVAQGITRLVVEGGALFALAGN